MTGVLQSHRGCGSDRGTWARASGQYNRGLLLLLQQKDMGKLALALQGSQSPSIQRERAQGLPTFLTAPEP